MGPDLNISSKTITQNDVNLAFDNFVFKNTPVLLDHNKINAVMLRAGLNQSNRFQNILFHITFSIQNDFPLDVTRLITCTFLQVLPVFFYKNLRCLNVLVKDREEGLICVFPDFF
jgi:hypothetical protein